MVTGTGSLRITPLGGVGEVGKNSLIIEHDDDALLIDAGVMFPEEEFLGIDLVIPDFSYVIQNADRLRGVLITHGHEDHLGAVPYLLRQLGRRTPIYGLPLTLGLLEPKLREQGVYDLAELHATQGFQTLNFGSFVARFIPVSHSVPDSAGIHLQSPVGDVYVTGDFKFEYGSDASDTMLDALREIGDRGVLALLSDCVRVDRPGVTPPESVVGEALQEIIRTAPGRVIVTTFASNITRMSQVIDSAVRYGRTTAVVGRSMEQNLRVARSLGYVEFYDHAVVTAEESRRLPPEQVVLLTTGSQGEPTSALSRIAIGDHPVIKLIPGDTVVISATPVPGNEDTVAKTIDNLLRREATVLYPPVYPNIHVSGHASRDELRQLIELLRPKFCMPIHGEYRHLVLYRALAIETGIPTDNVILPEIGETVVLSPHAIRRDGRVPSGLMLVDGLTVGNVTKFVLRDRRRLAEDGVVIAAIAVDRETGQLLGGPDLVTRGFAERDEDLLDEAAERVRRVLERRTSGEVEYGYLVSRIKEVLGRYIYEETRLRPMILPVVTEV